jgi:protein phosphatase
MLVALDLGLLAVADGMGGHLAGEVASRVALEVLERELRQNGKYRQRPGEALRNAVGRANKRIYDLAEQNNDQKGMGTTITACLLDKGALWIAQVGDSRAYLIRDKDISRLTEDHSLVQELYRQGGISLEEMANHPRRHVLTRALGAGPAVDVDLFCQEVKAGDRILLATDGLTNLLDDGEILMLAGHNDVEKVVGDLVRESLSRGGHDNITVIMAVVE